jgi:two-component system capsular synthesis response regulator RcsB
LPDSYLDEGGSMKTIFIADSEYHVRKAIVLVLEQTSGFSVAGEAVHAEGLLAMVCQQPPDVILFDWNLPGVNHYRLISTIQEYCPSTQLIVMSVRPEDRSKIDKYDLDGFLSKQVPPEVFMTTLIKLL